jgi:virulence factor Mce-like protein
MPVNRDLVARRLGAAIAVVGLAAVAVWLLARSPSGLLVRAEFVDARGLVAGNDVRINGAPAGSVTSLSLTRGDLALVTMRLASGIPFAPRADATAAIRPVDLLGDNYVALTLGSDRAPLRGVIPPSRTLTAPQLADLLNVFREPVRAGLQAVLVELGRSLDDRGADLNQAALALRPTLQAADGVMTELGSQNADLRSVITDADAVTAQAAARNVALGRSVADLNGLVQTTARHLPGLNAGLLTMPRTLTELTSTATDLQGTARAATPLAAGLEQTAPGLTVAMQRLPAFLAELRIAAAHLGPTLDLAGSVLHGADPTIYALGSGLTSLAQNGPALARFGAAVVPAAPAISQGFFVNFANQASEPGNQPFDPTANPLRDYWRGVAVLTCQSFGLAIAPGCLSHYLNAGAPAKQATRTRRSTRRLSSRPRRSKAAAPTASSSSRPVIPKLPVQVPSLAKAPAPVLTQSTGSLHQLLGYLLGR